LSGACVLSAVVVSGCFVDAIGVATDGGEGAATPATSTTGANGLGGATNSMSTTTGGLGGSGGAGGAGGNGLVSECAGDEVAVDIVDGMLVCEPLTQKIVAAIEGGCRAQVGWRDFCGNTCPDPADKWGSTSPLDCDEDGDNNTCDVENLGGTNVRLVGINLDGGIGDDDRWYAGFTCSPGDDAITSCGSSEALLTGLDGTTPVCTAATRALFAPLRACSFVFGWKDSCGGGCIDPPSKIGAASSGECNTAMVGGATCTASPFDPADDLVSFDTDGGVNNDDRFFYGLSCDAATPATTMATGVCPQGQFVNGINADGSLRCRTIQELSLGYFQEQCWLYAGWRDNCDGCSDPPTKWGRVRVGECATGAVTDDACTTVSFDGQMVSMFGLSPDGNVDGNDKFYVGYACQ
jgi:hypothetical protein